MNILNKLFCKHEYQLLPQRFTILKNGHLAGVTIGYCHKCGKSKAYIEPRGWKK